MRMLAVLVGGLVLPAVPAGASNTVSLGCSEETTIVGPTRECSGGTPVYHHDGSFETGYTWEYVDYQPAPYCCFGEGYGLGPGVINCAAYWMTSLVWSGVSCDLYIWEGGVTRAPGDVIAVFPDVYFTNTPMWPGVGENDHEMNVHVGGEFTVGYWDRQEMIDNVVYIAADRDGPAGHPWTCVPPGHGWPSGWQDPSGFWDDPCHSLGIGVYFTTDPTPASPQTWSSIKALFIP